MIVRLRGASAPDDIFYPKGGAPPSPAGPREPYTPQSMGSLAPRRDPE